jgi:hypothetical protein
MASLALACEEREVQQATPMPSPSSDAYLLSLALGVDLLLLGHALSQLFIRNG